MKLDFLYFTDLHVHNFQQFNVDGSRIENALKVLDDVFKLAEKNDIRHILFGGDLVDNFGHIPTVVILPLIHRFRKHFNDNPDIKFIAITGNHEQATKSYYGKEGVSFLSVLEFIFPKNFILIDNSSYVTPNVIVWGIPYYENPEHFAMALKDISERVINTDDHYNILMIHQTPTGLGNPNIPTDTDVNDPLYDPFDLVLCGHIHMAMEITPKFFLGGNPLHRDKGDAGEEKGLWLFSSQDPQGSMSFYSRKGRYPEFINDTGNLDQSTIESNFVTPQIAMELVNLDQGVEMENFSSSLKPEELVTNYWQEADKDQDKELLKTGLEFI